MKPRADIPELVVRPLTTERWPDLEALFGMRGCGIARRCWCMYYRRSGPAPPAVTGRSRIEASRAALRSLAGSRQPPGLIAYRGKVPVGWVSLGPREDFARLQRSPVMKAIDSTPVWSIICFVVAPEHRGQGVARELLAAAIAHARRRGARRLEAYPVDRPGRSSDETMWFGAKSMFDAAGFREVARRRPQRPVMRRSLAAASRRATSRSGDRKR
jgi:ribosomal protein S18 acetylase RimI-like enzyme